MKLLWHIARKDLWRHRGWLALWTLVLGAKIALGWMTRAEMHPVIWQRLGDVVKGLTWADGGLSFLIAVLFLQEDRVAGSEPFWVTRPISGARLLSAKLFGLTVALVGWPTLVSLSWWLACGFEASDVAWAVAELFLCQLAIVLPAALLATLTDTFARAMLWTLVFAMASAAAVALWGFYMGGGAGAAGVDVLVLRTEIALAVLALAIAVAVGFQFFTRRTVHSLVIFCSGLVLAVVALWQWPAAWRMQEKTIEVNAARAASVAVSFDSAYAPAPVPGKMGYGTMRAKATGVPANTIIDGLLVDHHTWRWSDGVTLERDGWLNGDYRYGDYSVFRTVLGLNEPQRDPETENYLDAGWDARLEALQAERLRRGWSALPLRRPIPRFTRPDYVMLSTGIPLPGSFAQRMRTEPPAYEATAWLRLLRPVVWWEQSLQARGWQGNHGLKMRITKSWPTVRKERDEYDIDAGRSDWQQLSIVSTEPMTLKEDLMELSFVRHERLVYLHRINTPYVVNRALGTLDELRMDARSVRICSVKISLGRPSLNVPKIRRGDQWVDWTPSWREGATLVMFGWHEDARFYREWKTERIEVRR